jgi:hypothetical protein
MVLLYLPEHADGHDPVDSSGHDLGDPGPGRRYARDLRWQFTVVRTVVSPFIPISGVALRVEIGADWAAACDDPRS